MKPTQCSTKPSHMPGSMEPTAQSSGHTIRQQQLPSVAMALIGSGMVAMLILSTRLGLPAVEGVLAGTQVALFLLGCWLLSRSPTHAPSLSQVTNTVGTAFLAVRFARFARMAFPMAKPPEEIAAIFAPTPFGHLVHALYVAECGLVQVLLRRLLPAWLCAPLAALQSLLFSQWNLRVLEPELVTAGSIARIVTTHLVGMFGPYHIIFHPRTRQLLGFLPLPPSAAGTGMAAAHSEDGYAGSGSMHSASPQIKGDMAASCSRGAEVAADRACSQPPAVNATHATSVKELLSSPPQGTSLRQRSLPARASPKLGISRQGTLSVESAIHALVSKPYQSQLRVARKVCLKLDTDKPCDSLPASLASELQSAVSASIGRATSLSITDVAVRPGCIAITLAVEEQLPADVASTSASCDSSPAHTDANAWAHALLPKLQAMLSEARSADPAFRRATVQLDDSVVLCTWQEDMQEWQVQVHPCNAVVGSDAAGAGVPQLGIARAMCIQPCRPAAWNAAQQLWEVVAEVQLLGATKLSDVQGWEPPAHHLAAAADGGSDYWSMQPAPAGSSNSVLHVLCRMGDGYAPTQLLRLVHDAAGESATAQVRVQLSDQQLVRHHAGGPPSTLLLLALELWQQEQLLSSSTLLSVPATAGSSATTSIAASHAPTAASSDPAVRPHTWWWGASDSIVAAAMAEVEQCGRTLATASVHEEGDTVIPSFLQFTRDLATFLSQVQRVAHSSGRCRCAAPGDHSRLQQPVMQPTAVCQLGQELAAYASYMGWGSLRCMLSQQLRSVVQPAHAPSSSSGSSRWLTAGLQAIRTALLGYPCLHDEQLYKQQLYEHFSGVLLVSSTAATAIGVALSYRSTGVVSVAVYPWALLHFLEMVAALMGHYSHGRRGKAAMRSALVFTTLVCAWRILSHLALSLCAHPPGGDVYTSLRGQPQYMASMGLAVLFTEKVPAAIVLPTWAIRVMLLVSVLANVADCMRLLKWSLATSCLGALVWVVGAYVLLDAHLRKQLSPGHKRGVANSQAKQECAQPQPAAGSKL